MSEDGLAIDCFDLLRLGSLRLFGHRPGQEALSQRRPRNHTDAEILEERDHLALLLSVRGAVIVLHRDELR